MDCRKFIYSPDRPTPKNPNSTYKRTMFDLWLAEFGYYDMEEIKPYQGLDALPNVASRPSKARSRLYPAMSLAKQSRKDDWYTLLPSGP